MSQTISDFRNFLKPDREQVLTKLKATVDKALLILEGCLKHPKISVNVEVREDSSILCDPNELLQVLISILNHSSQTLGEREIVSPAVEITLSREGDRAVLAIADNGGGIPEEMLDRFFEPHGPGKGQRAGTGAGLSLAKRIIENHLGGRILVGNLAGGAEFRIEI